MKNFKITISKTDLIKMDKSLRRKEEIQSGLYGCFKNKTHKSKKDYNRKPKHKKQLDYV